jgi:glucose-6-phosphate 1-epimerase
MTDRIHLHSGDDHAELSLQGGQLLRWCASGHERLFLSPRAVFADAQAIRGGVPLIFPQFAERGPGPRHGFARLRRWRLISQRSDRVQLGLDADERSLAVWPHRFEARLGCALAATGLKLELEIRNTDSSAFEFGAALHAYFAVDPGACEVRGLGDAGFEEGGVLHPGHSDPLRPQPPLDRIYAGGSPRLRLSCGAHRLELDRSGFADWVVWNPGAQAAAALDDLGAEAAARFLCIEPAQSLQRLRLLPGQAWRGALRLRVAETG